MGYIKKKYQNILNEIDDREYNLPSKWNEFISNVTLNHNLLIKKNGKCICTNCDYEFDTNHKVKEEIKCPNCLNKYLIKRSNIKNYSFIDYISLLDKVEGRIIVRYYQIRSDLIYANRPVFKSSTVEFGREIIDYDLKDYRSTPLYINERVSKNQGMPYIYHYNNGGKWRLYTRYYSLIDKAIPYQNNIKNMLFDTQYKYSMIWELVKHKKYIDLDLLFKNYKNYPYMELLVKMGLYNLAFEPYYIGNGNTFEKRFGIDKSFYKFMKRINITSEELKLLKLLKKPDAKKLRYISKYNIYDLEEIVNYIDIDSFIKYSKIKRKKVETYLYKDYLKFAYYLGFDLKNSKYAYPKDLRKEHNRLEEQFELKENKLLDKQIKKRAKILSMNEYKNKNYIIIPAKSLGALYEESKQQNNCVRTYAEKYSLGKCDIYFMRKKESPNKSLVTIEVKNNTIVQSRTKNNNDPNNEELKFLNKWEKDILRRVA